MGIRRLQLYIEQAFNLLFLLWIIAVLPSCYLRTEVVDKASVKEAKIRYANLANYKAFSISGDCKKRTDVFVRIGEIQKKIQCKNGRFSGLIDTTDLEEGRHPYEVTADNIDGFIDRYTVFKDTIPPEEASTTIDDGRSQYSKINTPTILWSNISDGVGSGIRNYEICLSSDGLTCDLRGPVNTSLQTFYQFSALNLPMSVNVKTLVRAFDRAENVSDWKVSDGFDVFRKVNLGIKENLGQNYNEGDFYNNVSWIRVVSGGESSGNSGVLFNNSGIFHIGNDVSYNSADVSASGRFALYYKYIKSGFFTRTLFLFDSVLNRSYFLAENPSEEYNMQFNKNETAVYFSHHIANICYIYRFDLISKVRSLVVKSADDPYCPNFRISPDDSKLTYISDKNGETKQFAYVINTDGTGEVKITPVSIAAGESLQVNITNTHLFILGDYEVNFKNEIWRFNHDGSNPLKLTGGMVGNGIYDIGGYDWFLMDSYSKIVFIADKQTASMNEVWSVNVDGTNLIKVAGPSVPGGDANNMWPMDDHYLILQGDMDIDGNFYDRYLVSSDGLSYARIHPVITASGQVSPIPRKYALDDRLLSLVSSGPGVPWQLYSIKMDGADLRTIGPVGINERISSVQRSTINSKVYYTIWNSASQETKLWQANSDLTNAQLLKTSSGYYSLIIMNNNGQSMVIETYNDNNSEIYLTLDLTTLTQSETGFIPAGIEHNGIDDLQFSDLSSKSYVVNNCSVFAITSSAVSTDLFPWRQTNGCVTDYYLNQNNDNIIAIGDLETDNLMEIFISRSGTQTTLEKVNSTVLSSITKYSISKNGNHLVYIGDPAVIGNNYLYYVDLNESVLNPIQLTGAINLTTNVYQLSVSEDGTSVMVNAPIDSGIKEIYHVSIPSGVRTKSHPAATGWINGYKLSEDQSKSLFCGMIAGTYQFRVASSTGTSSVIGFQTPAEICGATVDFSPSKDKVFYTYSSASEYFGVFMADGSGAYNLIPTLGVNKIGRLFGWLNNEWLLVSYKNSANDWEEIYKVKFDGSEIYKISDTSTNWKMYTDFNIFKEANKIIYISNEDSSDIFELFSFDFDTNVKVKLSPILLAGEQISHYYLVYDRSLVVFRTVSSNNSTSSWYKYDLVTGERTQLFKDFISGDEFLGDFVFNRAFTSGVLSVRQGINYFLHNVSF